jgi:fibro-slime domain-containing protein
MKLLGGIWICALASCGPTPRPDGTGGVVDAKPSADAAIDAVPPDAAPQCGHLLMTLRDFRSDHADMQKGVGIDIGLVKPMLGTDNKPIHAPAGPTSTVSGAASFNQWYRDTPGTNMTLQKTIMLVQNPPGTFTYDNQLFFPLDGQGFGNENNIHNFHFTTEIHTTFKYNGGEIFQFIGDDDVFVYVNKKLVADLGGVHDPLTALVDFDARATELGITVGQTYQLDVFHAERHTVNSTFKMVTTIDCLVIL